MRIRDIITLIENAQARTIPEWFNVGEVVDISAIDHINDDVGGMLEGEEGDFEWRLCGEIPIDAIEFLNPEFHDEERMVRLRTQEAHMPIIVIIREDGRIELVDGGHRIKTARERGKATIAGLVGLDNGIRQSLDESVDPLDGMKRRYSVLERSDLKDMAARFRSAEEYAAHLTDTSSPHASACQSYLADLWVGWNEQGFEEFKSDCSPLERSVADAIGATGWSGTRQMGLPWGDGMMGGSGMIFNTPRGRVFLDAVVEKSTIYVPQIAVERKGSGLGTVVMNAIRDYAIAKHLKVVVYKVCNHAYFAKQDWLKRTSTGDYAADFTKE